MSNSRSYRSSLIDSQIVDYICECQKDYHCSPTQREIAARVGRCASIVNRHLKKMEKAGIIRIRGARRIEIVKIPK